MVGPTTSQCLRCGFESESGSSDWTSVEVPGLGQMSQCPECASTDIMTR